MQVRPEYKSFGELFSENNVFFTPRYQRDYSWELEQIEQFCGDIESALNLQSSGLVTQHFFGGIVCAQEVGVGNRKIENMLVDGQQRISTIVMLFSVIKKTLNSLECASDDLEFRDELLSDTQKYITFEERVNREKIVHPRIKIGSADNEFYQAALNDRKLAVTRDSHKLIWQAKKSFEFFIQDKLLLNKNVEETLELIDSLIKLFEENFLLIHIISTTVDDAYRLFMVLNDRGINLTEGELLKAHTIGNYSEDGAYVVQMAQDWDLILSNESKNVSDYLRWIITMLTGEHIPNTQILEKYKSEFLTQDLDVSEMANKVRFIREACDKLKLISEAEWPFYHSNITTQFHKTKLDWLVKKLKHTHSMPLLLASTYTTEQNFQKVVSETCKFFIRYKVISNLHASIFSSLYPPLSKNIFELRDRFSLNFLLEKYRDVISAKDMNNDQFRSGLLSLSYSRKGDNRPIKYVLVTIQENWDWLTSSADLSSRRRFILEDKTVVFDFNNTTIEHLYPYNARDEDVCEEMEDLKNRIGNLVILDINTNASNGDLSFARKKANFVNSGIGIHEMLSEHSVWEVEQFDQLKNRYVELSLKAFSF